MKRIIAFLSLLLILASSVTHGQTISGSYNIAGIAVEGSQYTDKNFVISVSGLFVGKKITIPGADISDAIRNIWKQNLFSDVYITSEKVIEKDIYLIITISERPRIGSFVFNGISQTQADEIREKIDFIRGTIWNEEKKIKARRVIRNYFVEKGFYNVETTISTEPDPTMANGVRVVIGVDKKSRVKIDNIDITANKELDEKQLIRKMKPLKERRFYRFWSRSKYVPSKYDEAKKNLIAYYNENGYRDAQVVEDTVYTGDGGGININLTVYEGQQYILRNINWVGNFKYNADTLSQILGLRSGDIYNPEKIQERLNGDPLNGTDVASLYLDDGHLFFNVDPVEILVEGDSVDIELRMYEGPQAIIRKVMLEGNTKTSDYVVTREVRTLPGNKFSRADLVRSQREILNLQYFDPEKLNVIPMPDPNTGTVDIKYVVEEKPSDQLQLQGGWGGSTRNNPFGGFVGTVSIAFNNFSTKKFFKKGSWNPVPSGDGQRLSLAFQMNGRGFQNYTISFMEPWLGGKKPHSLGVSAYHSIQNPRFANYRIGIVGLSVDHGRRMKFPDDFFTSYTSLNYKYFDLRNPGTLFPTISYTQGYVNSISIRQSFERNTIYNPNFPKDGSILRLSGEFTPPYSLLNLGTDYSTLEPEKKFKWLEYYKIKFYTVWFHGFGPKRNFVFMLRADMGWLGYYSKDYGVSPFERFNMGGSGLGGFSIAGQEWIAFRGYDDNIFSIDASSGYQLVGSNVFNKYTAELRYPISTAQAATIWVHGFAEVGNAWLGFRQYNPMDLRRSAGFGIRIAMPMIGLLGLDWGYAFDWEKVPNRNNGQRTRFTFSIGQNF